MKPIVALAVAAALTATSLSAAAAPAATRPSARMDLREVEHMKPDPMHGEKLFAVCIACHGSHGQGADDGSVPMIAGQHYLVVAKELVDYRNARRWDIRMESVASRHRLGGPQDIADAASFVSLLEPTPQLGIGEGTLVGLGATVFADRCAGCHGRSAEGSPDDLVPRLAGQHYEYVLRQIYDTVDGRRPNMSRDHLRLFKDLDLGRIKGLADYLSRLDAALPDASPRGQ